MCPSKSETYLILRQCYLYCCTVQETEQTKEVDNLRLTGVQPIYDIAVDRDAKRVAGLVRQLRHILRPLPAVPVSTEEELRGGSSNSKRRERTAEQVQGENVVYFLT